MGNGDEDGDDGGNNPYHGVENMTIDIGPFLVKTTDEIVSMLKYIVKHDKSSQTTKGFGLTALMKIRHKYQCKNIDKDDKQIEVQQRSVEFLSLFENTDQNARNKILKPMPVPKIERIFAESKSDLKKDDDSGDSGGDTTESESEEPEEKSDKSDDSDNSDESDDDSDESDD